MDYIVCLALGVYIGYKIAEAMLLFTIKKILEELDISQKELDALTKRLGMEVPTAAAENLAEEDLPKVSIEIEKLGNTLYAYRKDNGRFLGQATSPEELIALMAEKLQDVKLTVTPEDGGLYLGGRSWSYDASTKEVTKD